MSGGRAFYNEIDPFCGAWLERLSEAGHIAAGDVDTRDVRDVRPGDLAGELDAAQSRRTTTWSRSARPRRRCSRRHERECGGLVFVRSDLFPDVFGGDARVRMVRHAGPSCCVVSPGCAPLGHKGGGRRWAYGAVCRQVDNVRDFDGGSLGLACGLFCWYVHRLHRYRTLAAGEGNAPHGDAQSDRVTGRANEHPSRRCGRCRVKPSDVLEAIARRDLGAQIVECLSEEADTPWYFVIGKQTVELHRARLHDGAEPTYRIQVGSGLRMGLSFPVTVGEGETLPGAVARAITYTLRVSGGMTAAMAEGLSEHESKRLVVRDVMGSRLYLARHTLGDRRPLCVLACNGAEARKLVHLAWRVVPHNILIDEALEAEEGRHEHILTRKGAFPAREVFDMLSVVR